MQNIKDSFYVALRDRLAIVNPLRVMTIQGIARPAVVALENEVPDADEVQPDTFYLRWGKVATVNQADHGLRPLLGLDCSIEYWVEGSDALAFQDRGRALGKSDDELLAICAPPRAALKDFTTTPATDLLTQIFWSRPELGEAKIDGRKLRRAAHFSVFAAAEVDA